MTWVFYVLLPVLIHLVFSEGVAVLAGDVLDSAACTALSAFLVLPAAGWMYRQDALSHSAGIPDCKADRKQQDYDRKLRCEAERGIRCLGWCVICFLGGGMLNVIWSGILFVLGISSAFSNQTQEALLDSQMVMQVLGPGFLVPIAEELIFRGLVYKRMKARLNVRQAVFISSLLCALYHGHPVQMIFAFPMA
ncbi:MAG: CPBP family intramembrane metalloprotease, partial [Clostridiales bacterium]|nr:CPBP family intramembrane metalloprotease [Clostridiales bacterium]